MQKCRDHFGYGFSQRETTLHCNVVSHDFWSTISPVHIQSNYFSFTIAPRQGMHVKFGDGVSSKHFNRSIINTNLFWNVFICLYFLILQVKIRGLCLHFDIVFFCRRSKVNSERLWCLLLVHYTAKITALLTSYMPRDISWPKRAGMRVADRKGSDREHIELQNWCCGNIFLQKTKAVSVHWLGCAWFLVCRTFCFSIWYLPKKKLLPITQSN